VLAVCRPLFAKLLLRKTRFAPHTLNELDHDDSLPLREIPYIVTNPNRGRQQEVARVHGIRILAHRR
jgi:hypothetical protein